MPVEPQVKVVLDQLAALGPTDYTTLTAAQLRESYALMGGAGLGTAPSVPATDAAVAGPEGDIGVRIYEPPGSSASGPTVVFFHGGGWVIGDLDTHDGTCRRLAVASGMRIVAVDYRLGPEAVFPAAVDDCHAAYLAVVSGKLGGPPSWVAVAGDSAGGNLSAVECILCRETTARLPDFQLLIYPATDMHMTTQSHRDNASGYLLTREGMEWFQQQYRPDADDWRASPILAASHAGLPPAYIVTAEYDPLRDEGEAYGDVLRAAGVHATVVRYAGQIHGFFGTPELFGPTATAAVDAAGAALRRSAGLA